MNLHRYTWAVLIVLAIVAGSAAAQVEFVNSTATALASDSGMAAGASAVPNVSDSVLPSLTRLGMALLVIIVIIYLAVFLMRKLSGGRLGGGKNRTIQIVEQAYLAPKKSVCLIKLADRLVLVGVTDSSISMLTEFDAESMPPDYLSRLKENPGGFQSILGDVTGKLFGKNRGESHA